MIQIRYQTERDEFYIEGAQGTLHIAPNADALLNYVRDWASQQRTVHAHAEQMLQRYGTLAHGNWYTILEPYTGLQDWDTVQRWFQNAVDAIGQAMRTRPRNEVIQTAANWFRQTGIELAHEMYPRDASELETKWRDRLNALIGHLLLLPA